MSNSLAKIISNQKIRLRY